MGLSNAVSDFLSRQRDIQARCVHPSDTFVEFPPDAVERSIPERFEQQVRRCPDRLAVQSPRQALTYAELDRASHRISRAVLDRRGEGAEPIALLFEHDAPMVAALLGVLKAGKFHVPLDPSHPPARTAYVLEDSQAGLLVTNSRHLPMAQAVVRQGCQILNVDDLTADGSASRPPLSIAPEAFAYLLYTSGSTGRPKGVIENHRDVLHFSRSWTNRFHLCAEDRIGLLAPFTFSASASDIFSALLNGACLCPFDLQGDGIDRLAEWLIREEITTYNSVPILFRQWVDALTGEETFPALRLIRLGGDQASGADVERYRKHFAPGCILFHGFGAAEVKTIRGLMLDHETPVPTGLVPAGYAVEGSEVLLLDEEGRRVGADEIGEIAVKTRYASPGYWRRPDLTAARFLPDPEGTDARIYLTGDLGRMGADGCLFHLGRKDFQVKIRGQRVEIAEVEQALLDLDAVKEAVVVSREAGEERLGPEGDSDGGRAPGTGDKRLVAYLVPCGARTPTVTELRRALAARLPGAMVPAAFVVLDALPLTASGKVDRPALPPPGRARPALEAAFVAPRTPVEERLVGLWGTLLALDAVGIHDSFFDLGGHSLLATQLLSQIREGFQLEVPLRAFFEAPTVAGLAVAILQNQAERVEQEEMARLLVELEDTLEDEAPARHGAAAR